MRLQSALLGLFISLSTFAGNGSSGGGLIYGDQLNPWFVQNTKTVNYCVEIAPEFSDLSRDRVVDLIQESLNWWKKNLANASTVRYPNGYLPALGTQTFILQQNCNDQTDVRFYMGVLPTTERALISYKQTIGLAYRTAYDSVNLRANGFIYIAPERGPLRPDSSRMHAKPWSVYESIALKHTLHHELGHIFGLQDDHYEVENLMSAHFVERITDQRFIATYGGGVYASPYGCGKSNDRTHNYATHYEDSHLTSLATYFGLQPQFDLKIRLQQKQLFILDKNQSQVIGNINLDKFVLSQTNYNGGSYIYLTKKQKVFTQVPEDYVNFGHVILPRVSNVIYEGVTLELTNGGKLTVNVRFDENCIPYVGGVYNGVYYKDMFGPDALQGVRTTNYFNTHLKK